MKDYYRTLGILDDAEDIIIRAAYRALAQRYHPDKWRGDQVEANKRMSEINEAYGILSDTIKRKKFDEDFFKYKARDEASEQNFDSYSEEELDEIDDAWKTATDFFPSIKNDFLELRKINSVLAKTFITALIESQLFDKSSAIRKKYEIEYLQRFYGNNKFVREFAKFLLINNQKNAAVRVNTIVRHLGDSATYTQIYDKVASEFSSLEDLNKANFRLTKFERNWNSILQKALSKNCTDQEYAYILLRHFRSKVIIESQMFGTSFDVDTGNGVRVFTISDILNLVKNYDES